MKPLLTQAEREELAKGFLERAKKLADEIEKDVEIFLEIVGSSVVIPW